MSMPLEFSESLDKLPQGMSSIPPTLQNKLRYDPEKKILILTGSLSNADRDQLRSFSMDVAFWIAVERLYEKSAAPPEGLHRKEGDDAQFVTEELAAMKQVIHRSLACWFVLLGFGSIFLVIWLWPSTAEMQTPADRRVDSLAQLVTKFAQPSRDATASDSLRAEPKNFQSGVDKQTIASAGTGFPSPEQRFLLIAVLAGVLGGSAGGLSSLLDFRGNRRLFSSWSLWYFAQPIVAGMIAVIFYVCIRAGFFASATTLQSVNVFGIAAFCAMVGLFTDDATNKLSEVFKTLFASATADARDGKLITPEEEKEGGKAS